MGSDIDHSGTVEVDERFAYTGSFKARNRLYIAISATDDEVIPSYQVIHDPYGSPVEVLSLAAGTVNISGLQRRSDDRSCAASPTPTASPPRPCSPWSSRTTTWCLR